jgi:hypothetical protein
MEYGEEEEDPGRFPLLRRFGLLSPIDKPLGLGD